MFREIIVHHQAFKNDTFKDEKKLSTFKEANLQKSFQAPSDEGKVLSNIINDIRNYAIKDDKEHIEELYNKMQDLLKINPVFRSSPVVKNIEQEYRIGGAERIVSHFKEQQILDANFLDANEKSTLELAKNIGLTDKSTREKLHKESLNNTLTDFQRDQIKNVQKGLQEDGKYQDNIDGIFGRQSTAALELMIIENSPVINEAKELLKSFKVQETSEKPNFLPTEGIHHKPPNREH